MNCRICNGDLKSLLQYDGMPRSAQFLPIEPRDKGITLRICQCYACGTVQLDNEPVEYHRTVVRASGLSPEMIAFRNAQFAGFVDRYDLKGKLVFEIGVGSGEFLRIMNSLGTMTNGFDYCDESLPIFPLYDGFYILNFLEHLPDVNGVLRGIRMSLREGAIGLIEVPNFDMILRKSLFSEFIIDHLFYFTKETLNGLLIRNGFEVLETCEVWHDYIISSVVRKRKMLDLSEFNVVADKVIGELDEFVSDNPYCAIWGASHQALTVIAMARLDGRVRYIVDSAPFKQGRYGSGIPIRHPNALKTDPVKAIIVMAASYSDEVCRIIDRDYPGMTVAVLRDSGLENHSPRSPVFGGLA